LANTKIGKIIHYYDKIGVAVLRVEKGSVKVGDEIIIGEEESGFVQKVASMQLEHSPVEEAKTGNEVGLKVDQKVNEGIAVYKKTV
jgi:U32 family peptidase